MMSKKRMIAALDGAFDEHMKRLFHALATSQVTDFTPTSNFARGLAQACDAYDRAVAGINDVIDTTIAASGLRRPDRSSTRL
jgi:hypothetical protein